ncbi:MAG: ATP-binding protein [Verrucomicrobia bacterium]|nr:ATP-binding protein [Verrucomicrobiota bacterium]
MKKVATDLLAMFADRIGTRSMRRFATKAGTKCTAEEVKAIRAELPFTFGQAGRFLLRGELSRAAESAEWSSRSDPDGTADLELSQIRREILEAGRREAECRPTSYPADAFLEICRAAACDLEEDLKKLCLDPAVSLASDWPWYFADFVPCLREYVSAHVAKAKATAVVTEIGRQVYEALDYAAASRCLVLNDGVARIGKTFAARQWCEERPGTSRYVQVPSTNDEVGFFRAIAKALGVSCGLGWKAVQLRERIEEVLQTGDLTIVFDEGHYLWPVTDYRYALPGRITWLMTALVNHGVGCAIVTTPQFIRTQKVVEKRTAWTSEQFIGRIGLYTSLPDTLTEQDLEAVARSLLPGGDAKSIRTLVRYAQASAKYLAGIEAAVRRARYLAAKDGRTGVNRKDINSAIQESVIPSDTALTTALSEPLKSSRRATGRPQPGSLRRPGTAPAELLQVSRKPVAVDAPGRMNFLTVPTALAEPVAG